MFKVRISRRRILGWKNSYFNHSRLSDLFYYIMNFIPSVILIKIIKNLNLNIARL